MELLFGTDSNFVISDCTCSCKSSCDNSSFSLSSLIFAEDLNSDFSKDSSYILISVGNISLTCYHQPAIKVASLAHMLIRLQLV